MVEIHKTSNSLASDGWDTIDISDDLDLFNNSPFGRKGSTPQLGSRPSSIREIPALSLLGQKHIIGEDIPFLDDDYQDSSDDESVDEMQKKMMRRGSLNRIIADSMEAIQPASCENLLRSINSDNNMKWGESRKDLVAMFWSKLNLSDRTGLAEYVRDYCDEVCELIIPDLKDTAIGKGDIMMLFSLLFEVYPDAVWSVRGNLNGNKGAVTCEFSFTGTNIFNKSIDTLYKETRAQSRKQLSIECMGRFGRDKKKLLDTNGRSNGNMNDRSSEKLNSRSNGNMNNRSNKDMLDAVHSSSSAQWNRPCFPLNKSTASYDMTSGGCAYAASDVPTSEIENPTAPETVKEFSAEIGELIPVSEASSPTLYQRWSTDDKNSIYRSKPSATDYLYGSRNQIADTIIQTSRSGSNPASPPAMLNTNANKELESMVIKHGFVQHKRSAEFVFVITGTNSTFGKIGKIAKIIIKDI